ncbi:hypothetical protein LEP1GSC036_1417 [Leptospira weilii str. 2006001853]|uniref:Uncharacterized protein n=1 Tax=Leptospira weilii str. 2006001853 TaxID=1001589 RepID=A0A828ZA33_9LEPT|nr:hypothetical protein LEP1GSC036_1417 [Leptospira weilii str. 2006001853]EMN45973.1 hypothetical protein LEP1GSC086_2167 [Leptospira weilii str. LNT 1234]OMI18014.1 hypothetical protein BUQ74_07205 [Leptospira weilii serovar Heyan]
MERKKLNKTLFTKAFQVASHFIYETRELRRRLIGSRCTLVFYSPKLSTVELTLNYCVENEF